MYKNDINLNLYKIFYEVALCGSVSAASSKMFLTQSAISKGIKKLEDVLDTKLFYRNSKGVKLTDKGKELLFYIKEAFNNLVIAERVMVESSTLDRGKLAIGVPSQVGSFYLFDVITKFHRDYPNIEIVIISKTTTQLLKLLEMHEIDFIIDTSPINSNLDNIVITPLVTVDNCFIVKSDSIFETDKIKSLKDLVNYPLILPINGTNNRSQIDKLFSRYNVLYDNVINIHTSEMIVGAIKKDLGIGYIIYDVVKDNVESGEFKLINLGESLPKITINLVYIKKYLSTAPKYFLENYLNVEIK